MLLAIPLALAIGVLTYGIGEYEYHRTLKRLLSQSGLDRPDFKKLVKWYHDNG